ncbi:FecR family protein [Chitinophaga barathri]|uniref:FecR family protein n=1 Tax=Chitinophaga barathri TaxID=1647451 RepID=A0A3N4MGR9_9BACT|nr:FecR family protein [Chitinophaga barathri]RPD42625.1 FecR family protein [Chitinophaga barathri]
MEADLEHIRQLYLQKLAGGLTEKEEAELEAAMVEPAVRKMCKELEELYQSPEMLDLLKERPTSKRWDELAELAMNSQYTPRKTRAMVWWAAAAGVAVLIGLAAYLRHDAVQQQSVNYSAGRGNIKDRPRDVRLKLAGGRTISLADHGSRKVGDVVLTYQEKTLQFDDKYHNNGQMNTLEVPSRLDYKIRLSDGTEVWLNSLSSIRFPFSFTGSTREVEVEGEAYFNVAADEEKPFIVHTPEGKVQVLGTTFNVNAYEQGHMITSLVDGAVKTSNSGREVILRPGQEAIWDEGREARVQKFDPVQKLAWMEGVIYFKGADFNTIATALDRWYDLELRVERPELNSLRFHVQLEKNKPIQDFMEILRVSKGFQYRVDGHILHIF